MAFARAPIKRFNEPKEPNEAKASVTELLVMASHSPKSHLRKSCSLNSLTQVQRATIYTARRPLNREVPVFDRYGKVISASNVKISTCCPNNSRAVVTSLTSTRLLKEQEDAERLMKLEGNLMQKDQEIAALNNQLACLKAQLATSCEERTLEQKDSRLKLCSALGILASKDLLLQSLQNEKILVSTREESKNEVIQNLIESSKSLKKEVCHLSSFCAEVRQENTKLSLELCELKQSGSEVTTMSQKVITLETEIKSLMNALVAKTVHNGTLLTEKDDLNFEIIKRDGIICIMEDDYEQLENDKIVEVMNLEKAERHAVNETITLQKEYRHLEHLYKRANENKLDLLRINSELKHAISSQSSILLRDIERLYRENVQVLKRFRRMSRKLIDRNELMTTMTFELMDLNLNNSALTSTKEQMLADISKLRKQLTAACGKARELHLQLFSKSKSSSHISLTSILEEYQNEILELEQESDAQHEQLQTASISAKFLGDKLVAQQNENDRLKLSETEKCKDLRSQLETRGVALNECKTNSTKILTDYRSRLEMMREALANVIKTYQDKKKIYNIMNGMLTKASSDISVYKSRMSALVVQISDWKIKFGELIESLDGTRDQKLENQDVDLQKLISKLEELRAQLNHVQVDAETVPDEASHHVAPDLIDVTEEREQNVIAEAREQIILALATELTALDEPIDHCPKLAGDQLPSKGLKPNEIPTEGSGTVGASNTPTGATRKSKRNRKKKNMPVSTCK